MREFLAILETRKREREALKVATGAGVGAAIVWRYLWHFIKWASLFIFIGLVSVAWLIFSVVFAAILKAK